MFHGKHYLVFGSVGRIRVGCSISYIIISQVRAVGLSLTCAGFRLSVLSLKRKRYLAEHPTVHTRGAHEYSSVPNLARLSQGAPICIRFSRPLRGVVLIRHV